MGMLLPSALLGLIAAAIPYLVHRMGKRHPTQVRFAAMQLLLRAERRVRARQKIRELLLLIARTAIAASVPFIFARPFVERASDAHMAALTTQSAVLLLDDSASMQRLEGGTTLWERAQDRARAVIRQLPADSAVALVIASEGSAAPVGELTMEKSRVLAALDDLRCSARPADFASAMRRSSVILAEAVHKQRRIFVFTDLQDVGWESGTGLPEENAPDVAVIDLAATGGDPPGNRGVVAIAASAEPDLGPGGISVTADIIDFGQAQAGGAPRSLGVKLLIDGVPVTKGFVELSPGDKTRKRFVHALGPGERGVHEVAVQIDDDAFPLDDVRRTSLSLAHALRVLIVTGDARTEKTEDETFFLESALTNAGSGSLVTRLLPDDLAEQDLDRVDVIFLANVPTPSAEVAARLTEFVARGGGVFVSVGSKVNAETWNLRLGALLPQRLGLVRTAATRPNDTNGEMMDDRPAERFAPIDRQHPLLASFPAHGDGLILARFFKYNLLEPAPDDTGRAVILRFESGAPALVERTIQTPGGGAVGRVMLLATTLDREWTDLPIRPGFLPLMVEATRRLAGATRNMRGNTLLVGETRAFSLSTDERRLEVSQPDGKIWVVHHSGGTQPKNVMFKQTDTPGTYAVSVADSNNKMTARPDETFVVNVDPRESTMAVLPHGRRPDARQRAAADGEQPIQREPLWHGLAALLIVFILAESLLAMRRRGPAPLRPIS